MQLAILGAVLVFIVLFYLNYFRKIKAAGGRAAAGRIYWREQFGLEQDEHVVSMGIGTWYLGPLVPETMRSTGERVFDALTGTTYRGANMWVCFTNKDRFAISVEETEDGPKPAKSSIGLASGYAPLAIFAGQPRPHVYTADQVWPGSPDLPKDSQKPKRPNTMGESIRQELIQLVGPDGSRMTFFVEGTWMRHLQHWCAGGGVAIDRRWVGEEASA